MNEKFKKIHQYLREIYYLDGFKNLGFWDQSVYLPEGASKIRSEQLAFLAKLTHNYWIDESFYQDLLEMNNDHSLSEDEKSIIKITLRDAEKERKKPSTLITELAELESRTQQLWQEARLKKDYSIVQNNLARMIELKKQYAACIDNSKKPYDVFLDEFEPGANSEELLSLFQKLKPEVIALQEKLPKKHKPQFILSSKESEQVKFFKQIAEKIGFDFSRGRIDRTIHPFMCKVARDDVRLTTRFKEDDIFYGLQGLLHEMGHGIYEQGLRGYWEGTPLAEATSISLHESQSLLFEKQVGKSREFQTFLCDEFKSFFPNETRRLTPETLYEIFYTPQKSINRLESDDVSYALHIILRTEIEQQLLSGEISVKDLPEVWSMKIIENFGQKPESDLDGCLQDIHWYCGLIGFFPWYLMGSIYSTVIMDTFRGDHSRDGFLSTQESFAELVHWLQQKVYCYGRSIEAPQVIQKLIKDKALTQELLVSEYMEYLRQYE